MYDNITPEERLQRIARLIVKAMYLYTGSSEGDCGVTPSDCEDGQYDDAAGDSQASGNEEAWERPLSERLHPHGSDAFRSRRLSQRGVGGGSQNLRYPGS